MRGAIELPNVHHVGLVLENRRLIVIHVEIVRCRENCHHRRKSSCLGLAVHAVPITQ